MAACWRFVVLWTWLPTEGCWFPGIGSMVVRRRFLPACFTSWFTGLGSMVAWRRFLVAWIHFPVNWNCYHSCLVKVTGYLDSHPGSLGLVPWLPAEGSWLPGFWSCFPGLGSMVGWLRLLIVWTWFHHCLVKVPGFSSLGLVQRCLVKVPGCLEMVQWLPGFSFFWLPGFV